MNRIIKLIMIAIVVIACFAYALEAIEGMAEIGKAVTNK